MSIFLKEDWEGLPLRIVLQTVRLAACCWCLGRAGLSRGYFTHLSTVALLILPVLLRGTEDSGCSKAMEWCGPQALFLCESCANEFYSLRVCVLPLISCEHGPSLYVLSLNGIFISMLSSGRRRNDLIWAGGWRTGSPLESRACQS